MLVQVTPADRFFRATDTTRQWADVISGNGANNLPLQGNRYNVYGQRSVYACDSPEAALAEAAFYDALAWQERIASSSFTQTFAPLPLHFSVPHRLWCFNLVGNATLHDVDHAQALLLYHHHRLILRNPSRTYYSTQHLATAAMAPPNSADGIKAPAVRCLDGYAGKNHSSVVFFIRNQSLAANQLAVWDFTVEFLPIGGGAVSTATARMDWVNPEISFPGGNPPPLGLAANFQMPISFV